MEDEIIKLQTMVGYQEEEISSLSKELYAQQKELAALKQQVAMLTERVKSISQNDAAVKDISEETPPPHY